MPPLPPMPSLPLLPIEPNQSPLTLPEQVYHPFHDNLNHSQDFIQNVNAIPAGDSNEDELPESLREAYQVEREQVALNPEEIDSLERDLENLSNLPELGSEQGATLSAYDDLAPLPASNSSEDYATELVSPSTMLDPSLGELPPSAAPSQDLAPEQSDQA